MLNKKYYYLKFCVKVRVLVYEDEKWREGGMGEEKGGLRVGVKDFLEEGFGEFILCKY